MCGKLHCWLVQNTTYSLSSFLADVFSLLDLLMRQCLSQVKGQCLIWPMEGMSSVMYLPSHICV